MRASGLKYNRNRTVETANVNDRITIAIEDFVAKSGSMMSLKTLMNWNRKSRHKDAQHSPGAPPMQVPFLVMH